MIIDGTVLALPAKDVDTDQIIPARFLTTIDTAGLGAYCMSGMPDGAAHLARVPDAAILVAGDNFGCGSSREHAVWALQDRGFRAIVAPRFGRIFWENAYNGGLVPIVADAADMPRFFAARRLRIDVANERVTFEDGTTIAFALDPLRKAFVLDGGFLKYMAAKIPQVRTWEAACRT
jgi:3-isopropylmalate/(R)-2-methylmalate dehydratase small subunit